MKKIMLFAMMMVVVSGALAQVVPSSCVAPDSVVKKYKEDAARLAVRKFFRRNYAEKDSVVIPKQHSDTVLNALLAVYNATSIPARDTVVGMYNVHTLPNPSLNRFMVYAPPNLAWMQQLQLGNVPTGTASVDSLLVPYGFYVTGFNVWSTNNASANLKTDSIYNTVAISKLFKALQGVGNASDNSLCCDGNDIQDSINSNHVALTYSIGWEDCPAGCTFRRYWKFNVYNDCSVSFEGSWGTLLPTTIKDPLTSALSLSPNPANEILHINSPQATQAVAVIDVYGRVVYHQSQIINHKSQIDCSSWSSGLYLVRCVLQDGSVVVGKVVKE
jgi:hypothetical protein